MTRGEMDIGRVLAAAEAASPVQSAEKVALELGQVFGALEVSFLITDASGRALVRLAHLPIAGADDGADDGGQQRRHGEETATRLPLDGGPVEQAMRTQTVQVVASAAGEPGRHRVLAPVTERGESIGLLELFLPGDPEPGTVTEVARVAHLLAFVVIANRRHTDLYEWGQRTEDYELSAEIQQRLLPSARTCEAAAFTLAGWLEPAASIGGDTFDYSLARDVLHLSLTDAMGHGVNAALVASMCLAALRGARRAGMSLVDQAAAANAAICKHRLAEGEDFATGIVGRLALDTGRLEIVNAGHVAPYLLRDSELTSLDLRVDLAFGMFEDATYASTSLDLEPGDRVVLLTDGMLERNALDAAVPVAIRESRDLHPREVVRALADGALEATGGKLRDDATVLCLDWHGQHERARVVAFGAEPGRASDRLA
ncbi:PP2C family protein-serine/threonine phosphatase [Nocardioides dongkuii]|uniref:PP2C family protein-serine/threonine phosphatase n=1 Tax=Nocardioides dongkuii TaxID=2760089 RepID=UPI001C7088DF|nr:PP2C family protein-serine/threonine phosphatase [Nocardioides dongkuii]